MYRISGLHQSYCQVSLRETWVLYVLMWMRLKTCIFPSLYVSSLQIRMKFCGCFWRISEWVLSTRGVELVINFNLVLKNNYLRVTGVGQGTALVCHSNILSLCLMKVKNFLWKYWSKTAVHFITRVTLWYLSPNRYLILGSVILQRT